MADYDIIVIPDLPAATSVTDTDNLVIDQNGTTRKVSISNFKSNITNYAYIDGLFDNGDLSAGVFTINHAKNTRVVKLTLFTPSGVYFPLPFTIVDSNNISVNFAGDIEAGDWTYLLEYWAAGSAPGVYPDPIYALAEDAPISEAISFDTSTGSIDAGLSIVSSVWWKYGKTVSGSIEFTSTYASETGHRLGILSQYPTTKWDFTINSTTVLDTENGGRGYIDNSGNIYVMTDKANKNYVFNLTFILP